MADYDYDLFVIGAGSGGVRAARLAAMSGARVAVAEEHRVGGTCVIRGCIPKKFMVYASEVHHQLQVAKGYGWSGFDDLRFDWKMFLEKKDVEIARLSGIYVRNLSNAGADDEEVVVVVGHGSSKAGWNGGRPLPSAGRPGQRELA